MKSVLLVLSTIILSGCIGFTGADDGRLLQNDVIEYDVIHPGLNIKIQALNVVGLQPIETVGKTSPSPLQHTIKFGTSGNRHILQITGKYKKDIVLDGKYYASLYRGDILIKQGELFIDGKLVKAR